MNTRPETIKTVLHTFRFDTADSAQLAQYKTLRGKLTALGLKCFNVLDIAKPGSLDTCAERLDGLTVDLETKHLFKNQWNTAPIAGVSDSGLRVFDWYETRTWINGRPSYFVRGHWLEQTEEMSALRSSVLTCGYCGEHYETPTPSGFCSACLGSQYLERKNLPLLRLVPVSHSFGARRAELSEQELAEILPRYTHAQIHGNTERERAALVATRRKIEAAKVKAIRDAEAEYAGLSYLIDKGFRTDNVIFYNHTGRFGIGWRSKIGPETLPAWLDVLAEFPAPYDLETTDGRKLSAD
jgi:hypothetical protein